mgnify:CR=1 FL=1
MKSIYWFRNDLRLSDNYSLNEAINNSTFILFVYIDDLLNYEKSSWGFSRYENHRKLFISQGVNNLNIALNKYGHNLKIIKGDSVLVIKDLIEKYKIDKVFCESIHAHEESKQISSLRKMGVDIHDYFHSTLYALNQLPFEKYELPDVFTNFRKSIELQGITPSEPCKLSKKIESIKSIKCGRSIFDVNNSKDYNKSSFPISQENFKGGEENAQHFVKNYFKSNLAQTYKKTRNNLMGINFSTKFSPWLALGFISARQIYKKLKQHESQYSSNDSTYWIFFELLWRDYFRFLFCKYGVKFFYKNGLGVNTIKIEHHPDNFSAWRSGNTKSSFINAGMNELKETGFLSNRMRQIVASYLVNELSCDWRSGASWFEAQLLDYDVHSNYGNWAYIAGCGTDPRGGRFFNIEKQRITHDPEGKYQAQWLIT